MTSDEFGTAFRIDPVAALAEQGYADVASEIAGELEEIAAVTDAFARRLVGTGKCARHDSNMRPLPPQGRDSTGKPMVPP